MSNLIDKQAAIDLWDKYHPTIAVDAMQYDAELRQMSLAQPETATVGVGISKGGVTMWYECDACGEPVDQGDTFCSGCGRRLKHE